MPMSGFSLPAFLAALGYTPVNPASLGSAAALSAGTAPGNLVRLDPTTGKLPAVDGSQLINLPSNGVVAPTAYTVTGAVTAGQLLAQRTDGTLEPVSGSTYTAGAGSVSAFDSSQGTGQTEPWVFWDSVNSRVVVFYTNANGYVFTVVGTIGATSIAWGAPVQSAAFAGYSQVYKISVSYDAANARYLVCTIGGSNALITPYTLAASTLTQGTTTSAGGQYSNYSTPTGVFACWHVGAAVGILAIANAGGIFLSTFTGAGTTLSMQTASATNVDSGAAAARVVIAYDPTNALIWLYSHNTGSTPLAAAFSYASSTFTKQAGQTYSGGPSGNTLRMAWLGSVSAMCVWSVTDKVAAIWSYSGSTYTLTQPSTPTLPGTSAAYDTLDFAWDSVRSRLVAVFRDSGNSNYLTSSLFTVTATAMAAVASSGLVLSSSATYKPGALAFLGSTNSSKMLFVDDTTNCGTILFSPSTFVQTNAANYIGVAAATAASGATTTLAPLNSKLASLSGLTPATDYYAAADGTLTVTPTYPKVGKALTASSLVVTGLAA